MLRKLLAPALLSAASVSASAQALINENFDYPNGSTLVLNGYTQASGGNALTTTNAANNASSLSFANYGASGIGGAVSMASSGQDVYRPFDSTSAGTVYASFLINVTSAQSIGDYFFHLGRSNSTEFFDRVFIRSATGGFNLGLSVSSGTATYSTNTYSFGTTYLVVVKYEFVAGTTNDVVSLFVPASAASPNTEGTPIVTLVAAATEPSSLSSYHLRQGSSAAAASLIIDGIRVGKTYQTVLPLALPSFTAQRSGDAVEAAWTTANEHQVAHMELQRSADGAAYERVATVAATNSAGEHSYSATDAQVLPGRSYYRLASVDFNGAVQYSKTVSVFTGEATPATLSVIPNPIGRSFSLRHQTALPGDRVLIHSFNGALVSVRETQAGSTTTAFPDLDLPAGTYVVSFQSKGEKTSALFVR